ncbi:MobA/MobL family protein [Acinetobacter thermotolerans]|uniref:MobA/MobL family protein n=1 Tax=Acinetobacter thermotolerans TaxID=3151487 RepID=UPI00325ACA16
MAIYHGHLKSICRADNRSATASIGYRAACKIVDERTGLKFDYTRKKKGVEHTEIFFPPGEENTRPDLHDTSALWNEVEKRETKANAQVAREYEFSFPHELNSEQRKRMLSTFCKWLTKNFGVVAQGCIHVPHGKDADVRNYHAHILFSTRRFENGKLTDKTREFSKYPYDKKELEKHLAKGGEDYTQRLHGRKNATELLREAHEKIGNHFLIEAGYEPTLDRRSYAERGVDREPTHHEGAGRAMANRGLNSETHEHNQEIIERNKSLSELQNEIVVTSNFIKDLDKQYGELSQLTLTSEAEQNKQRNELLQPEMTLNSFSLARHIQFYYDNYSQELIKRTKLQDEALNRGDNDKAMYYMEMKYESINHCLSKQDIDDLYKTKVFIKNDKALLDALVQQRIMSSRQVESVGRIVNNALTSCERTIERKLVVLTEIGKILINDQKHEKNRRNDDYNNTFTSLK